MSCVKTGDDDDVMTLKCECGCKHFYIWDDRSFECLDCENTFSWEEIHAEMAEQDPRLYN